MAGTTKDTDPGRPERTRDRPLSRSVEEQINENLKRLYQQAADEPVPEHLLRLLDKLKQQGNAQ